MMTREEAIELFEKILAGAKQGLEEHPEEGKRVYGMRKELAEMALTALRPVSREQVEKVFGGKWEEETYTTVSGRGRVIHSKKCICSACGKANGRAKTNFCPHCGAPMTDEAVDILLRRLEALHEADLI